MLRESVVRRLASRCDGVVTSFYLDVDGRRYPRPSDYAPQVATLVELGRRRAEQRGASLVPQVGTGLDAIVAWLGSGMDRSATRGVAAFSDGTGKLVECLALPNAVRDQVALDRFPDVGQLALTLRRSAPILVVALDTQTARLLRVDGATAQERHGVVDPLERQVDTDVEIGSFAHRREEHARQHARRVADAVARELERRGAEYLVVQGTRETVDRLTSHLPSRVLDLLAGTTSLALTSAVPEMADAARSVVALAQRRRAAGVVDELRERVGQHAAAVGGLDATLEALGAEQATALVVEEGFEAEGGRCSGCDRLVAGRRACPRCGASTMPVADVVSAAISDAFRHHVTLEPCAPGQLADLGRVGTLERA